ncbi:MAG: peptide-binding protein [Candidatus Omnitrophica bacterium]|nr:peptide-binding protein [Candidatus Omnitrophota bacterium]
MPLGLIILSCGFLYPAKDACAFESGDALVVGSISDARVLVPILASDSGSGEIVSMLFNGLVKYDKDLSLTGDLAETWEVQDDCRVIIFHLRHNVRWHDGEPFTAADVEFTYNKLIDPGVRTPYSGDFERVKSFKVIDDYTIKVTYKEPFAPGISSWGMPIMPRHLLENEDLNNTEFNLHPVGTGPYKFKSWRRQEKIELIANPDYFEHKPYIERYIFRVIPDQATLFLELQAQGLDYTWLSPLQYQRQTNSDFFKKHFRKFSVTGRSYIYLGYNLNNSKFKDKRVRRALNYAVDKNEIIDIALLGIGQVCTGPFLPESWAFNSEVKAVPFDPRAARELLAAAGWVDTNQDGWLDKNGEDFEFTIITNLGNEERRKTAEIIQRRLAGIGIRVEIRILEWTVFLSEFIDKRNFDVILLGWGLGLDPDNYDIWHSSKTREGEFNFIGYSNEEVDRLLEKARRTCQQAEREVYYKRIHEIIYEEQPYMFLYISNSLAIVHSRFRNVSLEPVGIRYNLIDWWVPKEEQRYQIKY